MNSGEGLLRNATRILERVNEEVGASAGGASGSATPDNSDGRVRPLEDPYLVGEVAAARARRERLARENGDDVLHSEDRRWDWFLGKCLPVFGALDEHDSVRNLLVGSQRANVLSLAPQPRRRTGRSATSAGSSSAVKCSRPRRGEGWPGASVSVVRCLDVGHPVLLARSCGPVCVPLDILDIAGVFDPPFLYAHSERARRCLLNHFLCSICRTCFLF